MIPVYRSGKQAYEDFENGKYGWATVNAAIGVSDVVPIKAAGTALTKGVWKLGSHTWGATSKWLTKCGWREFEGQEMHHWLIPQNQWGKAIPNWIKNQPWNLMKMPDSTFHNALHGFGKLNSFEKFYFGMPSWFKAGIVLTAGKEVNWMRNEDE